jgi:hypothetical protein
MPDFAKDVALALLGAAVALAGLLLVVSGLVFAQANSFPPDTTDDSIIDSYRLAAKLGLVPFALALCEAALCLAWLVHRSVGLYALTTYSFFVLLAMTAVYGTVLLLKFL